MLTESNRHHGDNARWLLRQYFLGSLLLLSGCPGTLDHKERFLVDGQSVDGPPFDAAASDAQLQTDDANNTVADGNTADAGPCDDVPTRIFIPSCGGAGCHGSMAPQQSLDLVSPGVAARVVGVAGRGCSGTLANPKNPDTSLLYLKVLTGPACGAQMPLARPPLSAAAAACIRTWISNQ